MTPKIQSWPVFGELREAKRGKITLSNKRVKKSQKNTNKGRKGEKECRVREEGCREGIEHRKKTK